MGDWMRQCRARALAESRWLREYVAEFGRLPGCPAGLLEFVALERYVAVTAPVDDHQLQYCTVGRDRWATDGYVALRTGFTRHTVFRWRHRGGLNPWSADLAANWLGEHPTMIWPDFHLVAEFWSALPRTGRAMAAA